MSSSKTAAPTMLQFPATKSFQLWKKQYEVRGSQTAHSRSRSPDGRSESFGMPSELRTFGSFIISPPSGPLGKASLIHFRRVKLSLQIPPSAEHGICEVCVGMACFVLRTRTPASKHCGVLNVRLTYEGAREDCAHTGLAVRRLVGIPRCVCRSSMT